MNKKVTNPVNPTGKKIRFGQLMSKVFKEGFDDASSPYAIDHIKGVAQSPFNDLRLASTRTNLALSYINKYVPQKNFKKTLVLELMGGATDFKSKQYVNNLVKHGTGLAKEVLVGGKKVPVSSIQELGGKFLKPSKFKVLTGPQQETIQKMAKARTLSVFKQQAAQLNAKIPGVSQLFDMAKSIPGDFAKKKYLRAGFKTLGIAVTPLIIYDAYQAAKEGKPFAEILERGLIGTEGVYKAKEYMSLSPEAKEASARINMQKMAEAGREDPRVKGYGGEWQPDFVKPEDEQQLLAEKEKYRLKREGEDQARARAYLDAVLGIKDLATGARFTQPSYGMELARGGLTRTLAPDSGPMSQGLRSLYIDDMD